MNLSVIIPTYKNRELFLANLKNNFPYFEDCQVIIVNDDPKESIKKEVEFLSHQKKRFIVLENKQNLGFGLSVNQAVTQATSDYLMILNSDVKLIDDSYKRALDYFKKNKNLFAVSFAQKEKDGTIVGKNKIHWQKGMIFHKKADDLTFGKNSWAEGGAAVFDKKKFLELSGFDSLFSPFYWEDIDLSYRAWKKGWEIIFDPSIVVIHHHQSTIGKYFDTSFTKTIAFRNQLIFIWKNITQKRLIFSHLFFLPYYFFYFLLKKEKGFFWGFFEALKRLFLVLKRRKETSILNIKSDSDIIKSMDQNW